MQRNELLHGLLGFVLGASLVGALTNPTPPAPIVDETQEQPARTRQAGPPSSPPRDAGPRAPEYVSDPAGPSTGPVELSEAGRTFARTMQVMLERRSADGASFDPLAFRRENQALFCEFDGAMNAMSTTERQQVIDGLGFTRDVLIGKNHLVFHGCALPTHTECPNEATAPQ